MGSLVGQCQRNQDSIPIAIERSKRTPKDNLKERIAKYRARRHRIGFDEVILEV